MLDKTILKQSLIHSAFAVLYVAAVVTFMQNAERFLGSDAENPAAPVAFLLLLVVSAATMGMLIFGKPVMMYLDGKKREAVTMACYTISSLAAITVLLIVAMAAARA